MTSRYTFISLILLALFSRPSFAEDVSFIKEYTYMASDIDSKVSSRAIALEQVKRTLLDQLGTYLISETTVRDYKITKDQITTLTAGIVSAVIIEEKWDGKSYYLKAKISADTNEIAKSIDALRHDMQKSKELEESKKRAEEAMTEVERLKRDLESVKMDTQKQGDYNSAIRNISESEWFDRGMALVLSKDYRAAIAAFTNAIELNPQQGENYFRRGLLYFLLHNHSQAIDDFSMAIKIKPKVVDAYYWRGLVNDSIGNNNGAMDDYDRVITLNPKYAEAYDRRGASYCRLGINDKGIADLDKAIQLKTNFAEAYLHRGTCYINQKKHSLAIKDLNRAISLNPRYGEAYFMRGLAYGLLENRSQADDDISIAARLGNLDAQEFLKENGSDW